MGDLPVGTIQNELAHAIRGKGAFRKFKDTIRYYGIEQQWYDNQKEACKQIAIQWCQEEGLEYEE